MKWIREKQTRDRALRSVLWLVAAVAVAFGIRSCIDLPVERTSPAVIVMDTTARVIVTAGDEQTAEQAIAAAIRQLRAVESSMSAYDPDSELSLLNRRGYIAPMEVSEGLFEVLRLSVEISRLTDGAFDVSVGPILDLYRRAAENEEPPAEEELELARAKVGYEKILLDAHKRTVQLGVEGMRLDLGGIAKGYAIDLAVEAVREAGAAGALVDVGGDIRCFGRAPRGKNAWRIALQHPRKPDAYALTLEVNNTAVTTSGDYRRFVLLNDGRRSHIVNPKSPSSASNLSSVTILTESAARADALATAVTVMGPVKGFSLVESLEATEGILISSGGETIHCTQGAGKFIKR